MCAAFALLVEAVSSARAVVSSSFGLGLRQILAVPGSAVVPIARTVVDMGGEIHPNLVRRRPGSLLCGRLKRVVLCGRRVGGGSGRLSGKRERAGQYERRKQERREKGAKLHGFSLGELNLGVDPIGTLARARVMEVAALPFRYQKSCDPQ